MIQMLTRLLNIRLPMGQSAFLWGPRKTGKTTFIRIAFPESLRYDLLQTDIFLEFVKRPFLLREQLPCGIPGTVEGACHYRRSSESASAA